MGTWDSGAFDNDWAADWACDFDDLPVEDRMPFVVKTFDAVIEDNSEFARCSEAIAAAAVVASMLAGGAPVDPVYGPGSVGDAGFVVTNGLRTHAQLAVRRAIAGDGEWHQQWADSDDAAAATAVVTQLARALSRQ